MTRITTAAALERFGELRILCVGDVMLDRFIYGAVARVSPEAPIPVLQIAREQTMIGGVGNVARNLAALGAHAVLIGVCGGDEAGAQVQRLSQRMDRVDARLIVDGTRSTTVKQRFIAAAQQLLRADQETVRDLDRDLSTQVLTRFGTALVECDAVILSDYAKGMLPAALLAEIIARAREAGKPVLCDPKRTDFSPYAGVTLIKPNLRELGTAVASDPAALNGDADAIAAAARRMIREHDFEALLVTQSAAGMSLFDRDGGEWRLPAHAREIYDVSGAGDTVIATLALALAAGLALPEAAELANLAGGIVVGKTGTAVVRNDELALALQEDALHDLGRKQVTRDQARDHVTRWQARGLSVGFTNGCFDLLHPGHLALLQGAREVCDRLIVAINSDASVQRLKGAQRPLQDQTARAMVLAALALVDLVVVFEEDTPVSLLRFLCPDALIKGGDYRMDEVVGAREVQEAGGRVVLVPFRNGFSTTATLARRR